MFVLDEPSIGLHPRDMGRIIEAMHRLRNAGNTLVVVEHDPAVMLAADRLIDMGPGPGERGGTIVFDGTPIDIRRADTLTGAYLGGRKHVGMGIKRMVGDSTPKLILERRARPQPEECHRRVPVAAPGGRHRRVGLGQEHADAGRAVPPRCSATSARRPKRPASTTGCSAPTT